MDIEKKVAISLTASDLADVFISWGDDEQGTFINLIGEHFKKADFDAELQCCHMAERINKFGRDFIYTLANFIKVQKFTDKSPHYNRLINTFDHSTLR